VAVLLTNAAFSLARARSPPPPLLPPTSAALGHHPAAAYAGYNMQVRMCEFMFMCTSVCVCVSVCAYMYVCICVCVLASGPCLRLTHRSRHAQAPYGYLR
jgi:hypothetical protein